MIKCIVVGFVSAYVLALVEAIFSREKMGNKVESKLEMRCSDGAWYDGTLRVSPRDKYTIIVHFNDFDEDEDETFSKWDVRDPAKLRSKVRVQSIQLQDQQCKSVSKDQKICGCLDNGEERKYYDAEVTGVSTDFLLF